MKTPTLSAYTEERYLRELTAIKGLSQSDIEACLSYARKDDSLSFTGYNSSFVGGCIAYCATCDRIRVNDGPDSYLYQCRTCLVSRLTGVLYDSSVIDPFGGVPAKVKPLVWQAITYPTFRTVYHTADVGLGRYYQIVPHSSVPDCFMLWTEAKDMEDPPCGTVNGTDYPTLEDAKTAAQAEWNAFILSALSP